MGHFELILDQVNLNFASGLKKWTFVGIVQFKGITAFLHIFFLKNKINVLAPRYMAYYL